jgi:hypothetical protein
MKKALVNKRMIAAVLGIVLLLGTFGNLSLAADRRYYGRYSRSHHHSRLNGALVGGAAGLVAGALLGGGKGAIIGAGAGAGAGYLVQRHRNNRYHRRYYWRHHVLHR